MDVNERSLRLHEENKGKLSIKSKVKVENKEDLSLAYTPGVAEPCRKIHANKEDVYKYTSKGNTVAVITDGSAVLGLGDIGPEASLPVMEGKCILFKEFADVDALPICIDSKDVETIIQTVKLISPTLGGINLEDISAPRCFEIEERLKKELGIPVFHDDQHGTAIVVLTGILNSCRLLNKNIEDLKIVINGSGSAGIAICKILSKVGVKDIILCDTKGAIYKGRENLNWIKEEISEITNKDLESGRLEDIIVGKDVFIGVSAPNILTGEMVKSMSNDSIIFALANPIPEIMPDVAQANGAKIIATGRSDFPNQINNVLAFPGIFRGALDARAEEITDEMKIEAAKAIASIISDEEINEEYIIPDPFDKRVMPVVAEAVRKAVEEKLK
ncbi:NAD-dependent malic enzyme [Gottschalkia acidurici 9a]|uniref:NAD-dependent malic enzyme n=1 Tax=Gottschalkia acidurici (strain ATCC 7906 / DSM 604 / BCRC 14475 / CIP 104303 / KCTC 5404 / NCIMB 10678 / 9a) TaxID=1128398 RepID=K0ATK5_GOTA9|nr:NADP-dependent malic enzyme [Gottschalkia acidurici]AFS77188.1 NAD-dependent malic enzyme [Gottschalkia acidurici 9a]